MSGEFTPTGVRIEGAFENNRNARMHDCFRDVIRRVWGVQDVIIGHHLVYVTTYKDGQGFDIQVVEEIPAADTLLFDHDAAHALWGDDWQDCLVKLACAPVAERDAMFRAMYDARYKHDKRA